MAELSRERCQSCTKDTPTLPVEDSRRLLEQLHEGWSSDGSKLTRRFTFTNFASAFTLATRVALLAERESHHPEMRVGWGYLELELTTHAAGGLTRNDFILASKIDRAAGADLGG